MICISKDSSIYLVWIKSAQNWGEEIFLNQSFLTCIIGHPEQNYYNHHQHVSRFLYGERKKIGFFLVCQLAVFECKQAVVILSPIHTTTNQKSLLQSTNNRDALHLSCLLVFIIGYWKFGPQWSPKKSIGQFDNWKAAVTQYHTLYIRSIQAPVNHWVKRPLRNGYIITQVESCLK